MRQESASRLWNKLSLRGAKSRGLSVGEKGTPLDPVLVDVCVCVTVDACAVACLCVCVCVFTRRLYFWRKLLCPCEVGKQSYKRKKERNREYVPCHHACRSMSPRCVLLLLLRAVSYFDVLKQEAPRRHIAHARQCGGCPNVYIKLI